MRHHFPALGALALALAAAAAPAHAHAQRGMQQTTLSPTPADSAGNALARSVGDGIRVIMDAQERYFAEHGRYAARLQDLPAARHLPTPGVHFTLTAGRDWWVVLGGSHRAGVQQLVVWRDPGAAATADRGAAPAPAGR